MTLRKKIFNVRAVISDTALSMADIESQLYAIKSRLIPRDAQDVNTSIWNDKFKRQIVFEAQFRRPIKKGRWFRGYPVRSI